MTFDNRSINVVVPMVGRGTRTKNYSAVPKPLVLVKGKPIVEHAVRSLGIDGNYIFVIREFREYPNGTEYTRSLETLLRALKPGCHVITTDRITEGPACSALLAKDLIDNDNPLIITNCDQETTWNPQRFLDFLETTGCDGCVTTYHRDGIVLGQESPYSFIDLDESGNGLRLEEKLAVSKHALCGIHFWKTGKDFVRTAEDMVSKNKDRVNGEFYICKTYNTLIQEGKKVVAYELPQGQFHALGDTIEIKEYLDK